MALTILSEQLAARIAAGEVIEWPASVVKELIENSLDAGARRIHLEISQGGAKSISVTDDGCGIPAEDIALAFERFATSKIDDSSDLSGIATLGFRGEALPSIASVSRVEAISRTQDSESGARLVIDNGRQIALEPAPAPPGTTMRVTSLFNKLPARRKFMGSMRQELARIHRLVNAFALAHPSVAFSLVADGKQRLSSPGDGQGRAAAAAVYGSRVAGSMLEVADEGGAFGVSGLVGEPSAARGARRYITLAVNGRCVENRRLAFAVEQAYHGFLPERRFPIAILSIRAPLDDVDVNVHPAKLEVRLLRENLVFGEIQRAVRSTLSGFSPVRSLHVPSGSSRGGRTKDAPSLQGRQFAASAAWPESQTTAQGGPDDTPAPLEPVPSYRSTLPILRVIGQAHETYILAEGPDGLYLIDQHAAHERVLFEEIKQRFESRAAESQPLLEPESIDLDPSQAEAAELHAEELERAGFLIEPFGGTSLLLRAVPQLLSSSSPQGPGATLAAILDEVAEGRKNDSWQDRLLYTMACHGSIRAGRTLNIEESRELVRQLEQAQQPQTCPHGRPVMVHLNAGTLEYQFGRR